MTWKRIDENTYIDDTLVTCAEYQLFIDEMRKQGKYYQPDHWTSYHFFTGQAHKPILGVRYSDAVAFCDWLTVREVNGWRFRMPSHEEATSIPLKQYNVQLAGYWIMVTEQNVQKFIWIGDMPNNARALKLENVVAYSNDVKLYDALDRIRDLDGFPIRGNQLSNITRAIDRMLSQATNLNHIKVVDQAFTPLQNTKLNHAFNRSLNSAIDLDLDRAQISNLRLDNVPRFILLQILEIGLRNYRDAAFVYNDAMDLFYVIFIDLYTLQERIAGRSPAFEGIRLVKERIR